ncbi:major facilitator superfamily domain-containing protein [Aspergillus varians]
MSDNQGLARCWTLNDGYSCCVADDEAPPPPAELQRTFTMDWENDDPRNPRNLPTWRRWLIVIVMSIGSLCVTCTSSIYTTTYGQIAPRFHSSSAVNTLGLGPLLLGPLSEFYGRRLIYLLPLLFFLIWLIPCAVAQNIQTLIISRFFNGFAGSAFLSVAGGAVAELFSRHDLSAPMMVYTASPFIGPELGPLLVLLIAIFLLVPETYHPMYVFFTLEAKCAKKRRETGDNRWKAPIERKESSILSSILHSVYRPILLLTMEPMCLNLCIFSAILLGILYLFFGAFQLVFDEIYGFSLWQRGCLFLGILVGMLAMILTDPLWRRNYNRLERKGMKKEGNTGYQPEWRLPPAIMGAPLVTIGLFIFAWAIYPNVHWIGPIIGSGVFRARTLLVYTSVFTFLVDTYPSYAASALSTNSFARSTFGGVFPLFGMQMYHRLGYHWATSLLAFLTLLMMPFL